jgi:hypothetical protein
MRIRKSGKVNRARNAQYIAEINTYRLMFVDPCIIVKFIKKFQQDATMYQTFIIPYLYEVQHVLGHTSPIIRRLKLHWQPLVFIRGRLMDV